MIQNSFIILLHFPVKDQREKNKKINSNGPLLYQAYSKYIPLGFPIIQLVREFTIYSFEFLEILE